MKGPELSSIKVERTFTTPPSEEDMTAAGIRERPCLSMYHVTWKRSLLCADRLRMICE